MPFGLITVEEFCEAVGISEAREPGARHDTVGKRHRMRRQAVEEWLSDEEARGSAECAHAAAEEQEPLALTG